MRRRNSQYKMSEQEVFKRSLRTTISFDLYLDFILVFL